MPFPDWPPGDAQRHRHLCTTPALSLTIAPCKALINHSDLGPADRWLRGLPLTWCQVLAPCQMPIFSSSLFTSQDAEMQWERSPALLLFCLQSTFTSYIRQRPGEREAEALHILKKLKSREGRDQPRWRGVGLRARRLTRANGLCFIPGKGLFGW